jgi:TPR repeat protein
MDDFQRRFAEVMWQREPELIEDMARLKGLLSDYLPHSAYRRALLTAVERKVADSIQACSAQMLPILRSREIARLKTEGLRDEDAEWTVDTLALVVGPAFDPEACFQMGKRLAQLENAERVEANLSKAAYCFRRSAHAGHAQACLWLGEMLRLGKGLDRDSGEAIPWFTKATSLGGSLIAYSRLGDLLVAAQVPNFPEAFRWYSEGTKQNDETCIGRLADLYEQGHGVDRNVSKALELWQKSLAANSSVLSDVAEFNILRIEAEARDPIAQVNLGITFENGEHPEGKFLDYRNEWGDPRIPIGGMSQFVTHTRGFEPRRRPDFEQAVHWYRIAAEAGDADGQYNLGDMYEHGNGVEYDLEEAMKWYGAAALQQHPEAEERFQELDDLEELKAKQAEEEEEQAYEKQRYLEALRYADGHSVKMGAAEVVEAYRAMAERGNLDAQVALASMLFYGRIERRNVESIRWYKNGRPVQDEREGIKWYCAAATQGHLASQKQLGDIFFEGEAVSKDYEESLKWFLLAAKQGDAYAQYSAGWLYEHDDSLEGYDEFESEAGEWDWLEGERGAVLYWKAALQGHAEAAYRLAKLIEELGFNTAELYIEDQIRWHEVAACEGHIKSAFEAACLLEAGSYEGEELDEKQVADNGRAFKWFLMAAEAGHERSQLSLSHMYKDGRGVSKNPKEALRWALRAAEQGASDAQLIVSEMYSGGHGVKENRKEAAE